MQNIWDINTIRIFLLKYLFYCTFNVTQNQKKVTARYAVHKWKSLSGIPDNPITGTGQFGHGSHDAMYCKIDKTSRSFTLQPSEKSSKNLSSVFELPIRTPELIIPNIYRESDGNESDLFVTYIEQYGKIIFF